MSLKFIAEFCQNHMGDPSVLGLQLEAAQRAGFTHAKIQGLYSHELTYRPQFEDPAGRLYRPFDAERSRLSKLDLSEDIEAAFVANVIEIGMTPMITVFTHEGCERARRAGFKSIKIASYDCGSLPLIESVLQFADELVVSTGATPWSEVEKTALYLRANSGAVQVSLLHARTLYPMPLSESGLARMLALKSFGLPVGFSDHSPTNLDTSPLLASQLAVFLGADVIERHFTVLPRSETKDGPVSVNEVEARNLADFALLEKSAQASIISAVGPEALLGAIHTRSLEPTDAELSNAEYYRGRVASIKRNQPVFSWEEWD